MMAKKSKSKGAIELSLGFIVTVVFAVVLLSLAIYWIQTMFSNIGTLTDDVTQKAHDTLSETFQTGATNFGVYPKDYSLSAGKGVKLSVAIKNDDKDGKPHDFVVHVYPATTGSSVLSNYGCTTFAQCDKVKTDMMSWVTYPDVSYKIQPNLFRFWDVSVVLPSSVVKGIYQYDIVACEDTEFSACDRTTTNWGSTLALQITAK
jgi:hypothetical protein